MESPSSSTFAIVAALNEEEGIGRTLSELRAVLGDVRLVVVDGRSVDGTVKIAESMGAQVLQQMGVGKGDAIATAIARAGQINAEYLVLTDADYTYPAEHLLEMIRILDENPNIGMVCGNRFNSHMQVNAMKNVFYSGNRLLAFSHNMLNGVSLRDPLTGLRVIRWSILRDWKPKSKGFDIEVELNHFVENKGFSIAEVPIAYRPRLGEKKLKLKDGFSILRRILSESF